MNIFEIMNVLSIVEGGVGDKTIPSSNTGDIIEKEDEILDTKVVNTDSTGAIVPTEEGTPLQGDENTIEEVQEEQDLNDDSDLDSEDSDTSDDSDDVDDDASEALGTPPPTEPVTQSNAEVDEEVKNTLGDIPTIDQDTKTETPPTQTNEITETDIQYDENGDPINNDANNEENDELKDDNTEDVE